MIELNLTYEESKKIFELGYDFSPVCPFYRVVKANSISLHNGIEFIFNLGLIDRLEDELLAELNREKIHPNPKKGYRKSLVEKNIFVEIIPLIPKAALEACLPDLSGSTWLKNLRTNWMILDLDPHIIKLESIFKAFMWCHENYPEELKRKFKEVIK